MTATEMKDHVKTTAVRYPLDLAEMLSAIAWYEGVRSAEILDRMTRDSIETAFVELPQVVRDRALARIESQAKK